MLSALTTSRTRLLPVVVTTPFALPIVVLPRYTEVARTWFALLILSGCFYLLANLRLLGQTSVRGRTWFTGIIAQFTWLAFSANPGWQRCSCRRSSPCNRIRRYR